jgi:hypothetical protein
MDDFYNGYMAADNELQEVDQNGRTKWLKNSLKSFDNDPAVSPFQRGYKQLLVEENETNNRIRNARV